MHSASYVYKLFIIIYSFNPPNSSLNRKLSIPSLGMKRMRHRGAKYLAQDHTALSTGRSGMQNLAFVSVHLITEQHV